MTHQRTIVRRLSVWIGRLFSNPEALLYALLIYVALTAGLFLAMLWNLWPNVNDASFAAYEIATGGDPFNFKKDWGKDRLIWTWILVLHVVSWLIVPVLIATAIDAAYRIFEQTSRAEKTLREIIGGTARNELNLSDEEAKKFMEDKLEEFQRKQG